MRDLIRDLESWYAEQCDGEWEHQYGVNIDTLDNPGWAVNIEVVGTKLEDASLSQTAEERSSDDWIQYSCEDGSFKAAGGPSNLAEILGRFLEWVEANESPNS